MSANRYDSPLDMTQAEVREAWEVTRCRLFAQHLPERPDLWFWAAPELGDLLSLVRLSYRSPGFRVEPRATGICIHVFGAEHIVAWGQLSPDSMLELHRGLLVRQEAATEVMVRNMARPDIDGEPDAEGGHVH